MKKQPQIASKTPRKAQSERDDKQQTRPRVSRSDGWKNILSGYGTLRDRRLSNSIYEVCLSHEELEMIWRNDDIAAKIVEVWPAEALRKGLSVKVKEVQSKAAKGAAVDPLTKAASSTLGVNGEGAPADKTKRFDFFGGAPMPPAEPPKPPGIVSGSDEEVTRIEKEIAGLIDDLGFVEKLKDALRQARCFGGAAIYMGLNDGRKPYEAVNLNTLKTVDWLTVLNAQDLEVSAYYDDPTKARYAEPMLYRIRTEHALPNSSATLATKPMRRTSTPLIEIHESRLLVFQGVVTSRRQTLQNKVSPGWGDSVLQRCYQVLSDFQISWGAVGSLLGDFAQGVFKIRDLAQLIANNRDDVVLNRMKLLDMQRSTMRSVVLDSEEDFERKATPVTGLDALLQQLAIRVAAAADMPVTRLFGQSPSGLNATGESDRDFFFNRVEDYRECFTKQANKFVKYVFLSKAGPTKGAEPESWKIEFESLISLSDLDRSTARKAQAETDQIYINAGVLTPEEVAASRFGGESYSFETTIDFEGREAAAIEYEQKQAEAAEKKAAFFGAAPTGDPSALPGNGAEVGALPGKSAEQTEAVGKPDAKTPASAPNAADPKKKAT